LGNQKQQSIYRVEEQNCKSLEDIYLNCRTLFP